MSMSTAPHRSRFARLGLATMALVTSSIVGSGSVIAADRSIEMRDFAFSPRTVEIRVGDRVTWTNRDGVEHNATDGSFDTGLLGEGESASIRFTAPGTYAFFCQPHPSMTGTVIVRSTAAPPTDTAGMAADAGDSSDPRLGIILSALALATLVGLRVVARRDRTTATEDVPDLP